MAPPLSVKLTVLVAVGTTRPWESRTATVTTDTSRPSARMVPRSGQSAMAAGAPVVATVFVITATPLL